jgi:hypothetical protein
VNYWVSDSVHQPVLWKLENTTFRKLGLLPSSVQWLRSAVSKGLNRVGDSATHLKKETPISRNVVFSRFLNTRRWTKSETPVALSVIHHRQNPLESISKWSLPSEPFSHWFIPIYLKDIFIWGPKETYTYMCQYLSQNRNKADGQYFKYCTSMFTSFCGPHYFMV